MDWTSLSEHYILTKAFPKYFQSSSLDSPEYTNRRVYKKECDQ